MARRDAAASAQPAPATVDLGAPEPPPAPRVGRYRPHSAGGHDKDRAKIEPAAEPAKVEPPSTAAVKIDPPAADAQRRGGDCARRRSWRRPNSPGRRRPQPPSISASPSCRRRRRLRPTSRAPMPMRGPHPPPSQVTASQHLLRDLNFCSAGAAPDGMLRSGHARAIVESERTPAWPRTRRAQRGAVRIAAGACAAQCSR